MRDSSDASCASVASLSARSRSNSLVRNCRVVSSRRECSVSYVAMPNPAVPKGTYTIIKVGEGTGGGIMKQVPAGPSGWLAYVAVDDIHAATKKAKSLGAEVMKDVTEVTGMGWFSFIRDPTGSVLGLWQTKT